QRERAIGVILSGTATDGTLGLEAIKAEGGLTFAQDDTARYDSMPRSAVAAGCVDFVLSTEAIARELTRIAKHPFVAGRPPAGVTQRPVHPVEASPAGRSGQNAYEKILLILRSHSGVDFSLYKTPTIHRRITRRMVLNQKQTLESYSDSLRGDAKELDALYADALINVTSFFRNPDAFDALKRKVFPQLLQTGGDDPLRVWVLGCSTGQEAYSLAMAFAECAEKARRPRKLQVFATDLNHANLDRARHGLYPKSATSDVSPERLRRFFVEEEGGYRIIKPLRESVVFARQNLISDPPFSRMDLISCRNLLIYLEPSLQKKLIPTFHYALKPDGVLFLGASESIGGFPDLFVPVDKKQKIFAKKAAPTLAFPLPMRNAGSGRPPAGQSHPPFASAGTKAGRARRGLPRRTQRRARGRPGDRQPIRPACRADQRRPANPAIPRTDRRVSRAPDRQSQLRPAEDGPGRTHAPLAGHDQPGEVGKQNGAQGQRVPHPERPDPVREHRGRAVEEPEGALLPRLV
ncbi:MAG: hypothetical protein HY302_15145, partial [Opitutae bacterium]|nr:hypothetical protein [Opitutae bacterium]